MTLFALMHGGWHGGWCWDPLIAELTARGHTAVAPDLPITDPTAGAAAYAEAVLTALPTTPLLDYAEHRRRFSPTRSTDADASRDADAAAPGAEAALLWEEEHSTHCAATRSSDVGASRGVDPAVGGAEGALRREGEQRRSRGGGDVVLVAHSLAGLVAPLVAAARPVRRVVYVAAMLPEPGRSVDDRARAGQRMTRRGIGRGQTVNEDGSTEWLPTAAVETLYPDCPPERAAWAVGRLRPQHWRITAEPSPPVEWPRVPATYVLCRDDRIIDVDWARAEAPHRAEVVEFPGDHSPFLARPGELADLLVAS
jgi:hypothetical protein